MRFDLNMLCRAAGSLIADPPGDDAAVGERFRALMAALVDFDHVVVFANRGEERPLELFSTFNPEEHIIFVSLYQDGAYLLDPFHHNARESRAGVFRMRELAPDRFFAGEYYRTYYIKTGLAEEIGFFVPDDDGVTIVLSLMRKEETGAFSAADFALLQHAEPLVNAMVRQFWGQTARRFDAAKADERRHSRRHGGEVPDRIWRSLNLTTREAAIIDLVLQGHSSESIGLRLSISTGTVKVHRRNVYRKLGISSQTQLLSLYLGNLKPSG